MNIPLLYVYALLKNSIHLYFKYHNPVYKKKMKNMTTLANVNLSSHDENRAMLITSLVYIKQEQRI